MDPTTPMFPNQPFSLSAFAPDVFASAADGEKYLSTLDSDTRAYVMEHAEEFQSMDDILRFVDGMRRSK